uniref:Uncharacterized protein n=1 Tax=Oryza punctata TaxID=4537 RepID=A0A0E0MN31_ORYPU
MCDLAEGSDSPPSEMLKDGAGTIGRSRWGYVDAGSEGPGAGPIGAVPSQENQRPPASAANRFLFANTINRQKLPLLGVSTMLIALIEPTDVYELCYITEDTCMKQEKLMSAKHQVVAQIHQVVPQMFLCDPSIW